MARTLSGLAQRELVDAVWARYRLSGHAEKRLILREFAAITGYHWKSVIRILNSANDVGEALVRIPAIVNGDSTRW